MGLCIVGIKPRVEWWCQLMKGTPMIGDKSSQMPWWLLAMPLPKARNTPLHRWSRYGDRKMSLIGRWPQLYVAGGLLCSVERASTIPNWSKQFQRSSDWVLRLKSHITMIWSPTSNYDVISSARLCINAFCGLSVYQSTARAQACCWYTIKGLGVLWGQ